MNEREADKRRKAEVLLALGVAQEQALFDKPSDEELAAMVEGTLDTTRKAQLMNVIANDAESYARWVAAVEMAETLQIGQFAADSAMAQQSAGKGSVLQRLVAFIQNPFKLAPVGGGLAAAALVIFLVGTPTDYQGQVDGLYNDYGQQWQGIPGTSVQTRSLTKPQAPVLTAQDEVLKLGIQQGLQRLGRGFSLHSLSPQPSSEVMETHAGLDKEQFNALQAAGQLAALSYFKCVVGATSGFFDNALVLQKALKLDQYDDEASQQLASALQKSESTESAETTVCRFSTVAIKRVTNYDK